MNDLRAFPSLPGLCIPGSLPFNTQDRHDVHKGTKGVAPVQTHYPKHFNQTAEAGKLSEKKEEKKDFENKF